MSTAMPEIRYMTDQFRERARTLIEGEDGAEALAGIATAHRSDVERLAARVHATDADHRTTVARLRTADDMTRSLHGYLTGEILRNARMQSHTEQLLRRLERIRAAVTSARVAAGDDAVSVPVADLEAILAEPMEHPEHLPTIASFTPEPARDRSGHFSSDDGVVVHGYPLVGWSLVIRQDAPEPRRLEPSFLVEERVLPESILRDVYGLHLRRLT